MDSEIFYLKCKYSSTEHELDYAHILPCSETVCSKCIESNLVLNENTESGENEKKYIICSICTKTHSLNEIIPNKLVNSILESKKAAKITEKKSNTHLKSLIKEFKAKLDFKNEMLNNVVQYNKDDITLKVESIKCELEKFVYEMYKELNEIETKFGKILIELNDKNLPAIAYKNENFDYDDEDKVEMLTAKSRVEISELIKLRNHLNSVVKTIKFVANEEIFPINYSFVGSLKLTNKNILNILKLQELKRKIFYKTTSNYSDISLNIVGLTMDTNSDILVSERNENRLIKIDKYCNFIKGSSSFSQLSNSCGICTNCLNQILVTDAKYNLLLKFNTEFNLIQSVGPYLGLKYGKFNYPWGLTTDSVDHFVYVCDYKNSRCIKFSYDLNPIDVYSLEKDQKPRRVQVKLDTVYLLHKTDSHIYISLFDKHSCQLLRQIKQFETNVKSIYIDDLLNIFTIGQLNNNDQTQNLNCYNKYNQLLFRTVLLTENKIWDFCFKQVEESNELHLYCASSEGLYVFEF